MTRKEYIKNWEQKNKERRKKRGKEYRLENKDIIKKRRHVYNLKVRFGITPEQHKQMFVSQNGMCAICGKRFTNRKDIQVDHDHLTGKVRQLLCNGCNSGIGLLQENTSILLKAVEYLNKWNDYDHPTLT